MQLYIAMDAVLGKGGISMDVSKIKELLVNRLDPEFILIFGSAVTGETHEASDLDIAFHKKSKTSNYEIFMLGQELAGILNVSVDLIDLSQASTVFRMQIFKNGRQIYAKNQHDFNVYEMNVFRSYANLNEQREVVLKEVHESGNVYGTRPGYHQK